MGAAPGGAGGTEGGVGAQPVEEGRRGGLGGPFGRELWGWECGNCEGRELWKWEFGNCEGREGEFRNCEGRGELGIGREGRIMQVGIWEFGGNTLDLGIVKERGDLLGELCGWKYLRFGNWEGRG